MAKRAKSTARPVKTAKKIKTKAGGRKTRKPARTAVTAARSKPATKKAAVKRPAAAAAVAGERPTGAAPETATERLRASWKDSTGQIPGKEHTKPGDVRATIRTTASRNWTTRQSRLG